MGVGEAKNRPLECERKDEKTTKSMNDAKEGKQATEKTPHNSAHQTPARSAALWSTSCSIQHVELDSVSLFPSYLQLQSVL
jgi:hypothetical protein